MVVVTSKKPTGKSPSAGPVNVFRAIPTHAAVAVKTSKRSVPKVERKNHKGWMQGLREELICPLIPGYVDALEISKAAGTLKMKEIQHMFHTYFPWPLEDWEELPRPLNKYDPLAPLPPPVPLTEERNILWAKHMNTMNSRLERWVKWRIGASPRRAAASGQRVDPNDPMIWMVSQMYQHEQYVASGMEAVVEAEFANRPDKSVKKIPLALKQRVAREFFARLSKEEQDTWVARAKSEADAKRIQIQETDNAALKDNPAVIATCVRNTPSLISKLSNSLNVNAGLKMFTMVAGPMGMYDGQVGYFDIATSKNSRGTGMSFMEWLGPQRSSDLVEAYMTYVETCITPADKKRVIARDDSVPDWSKTHNTLNDAATRTASFRDVGDVNGADKHRGNRDDNEDEDEDEDGDGDRDGDEEDEDKGEDDEDDMDEDRDGVGNRDERRTGTQHLRRKSTKLSASFLTAAAPVAGSVSEARAEAPKRRPKPRPAWTTERRDDDLTGGDAVMKASTLQILHRKRARQQATVESDEESEAEGAGESKRQRIGLQDITNLDLPPVPDMDTAPYAVPK